MIEIPFKVFRGGIVILINLFLVYFSLNSAVNSRGVQRHVNKRWSALDDVRTGDDFGSLDLNKALADERVSEELTYARLQPKDSLAGCGLWEKIHVLVNKLCNLLVWVCHVLMSVLLFFNLPLCSIFFADENINARPQKTLFYCVNNKNLSGNGI